MANSRRRGRNDINFWFDPLGYFIVAMFLIAAFAVLIPWGLNYSTATRHLTDEQVIAPDAAREELNQLMARIDEPGFTPAIAHETIKRAMYIDRHTPWVPKALLEEVRAKGDREYREIQWKRERISYTFAQIAQTARDKFRTDHDLDAELYERMKADAEYHAIADFHAIDTNFNWDVIGENFGAKLPFAFAFAMLFFIGMIKVRGLNLLVELMNPLSLILATATFPVSWLVYPYRDPDQQVSKVVNALGMAFSLLMSFGGVASAQTVKKSEGKKRDRQEQVKLQTDSRVMVPLGDDPKNATFFNRATFDFGGSIVENISLAKPATRFWYSEVCAGPKLPEIARTTVIAVGCASKAKGANPGWAAGIQFYRPIGKRFFLAIPVTRFEGKTFNFLGAVSAKVSKNWSVVPEVSFKLTPGKRRVISGGIVLRRTFGRGSAEAGILRNPGQTILRPRLIQNFAF